MRRPSSFCVLFALTSLLIFGGCTQQDDGAQQQPVAPDFTLRTLDGEAIQLSGLRGQVVFVNLWATWCPPCRHELPTMVRFYEQFRDRGVEILAVSEDTDHAAVREMAREYNLNFPVLLDENKRVYRAYGATGVPETYLVDRKGIIRASQLGPFDWTSPEVIGNVEALLAE